MKTICVLLAGGIIWGAFGLVAAGILYADLQGEFPAQAESDRVGDLIFALALGLLFAPISFLYGIFWTDGCKHGCRLW